MGDMSRLLELANALKDELSEACIHAKSLYLRCVHIPLYPRLTHSEAAKIVKVLSSLP